jgi:DNA repair and recombination protein RAD54B
MIDSVLKAIPSQHMVGGPRTSAKLQFLHTLLVQVYQTTKEKVVVVSNYTSTLDIIEKFVASLGYKSLRLDGQTPAKDRSALVDRFNKTPSSSSFVFLLSAKAGGLGINLIGASRLVLFDIDWNPATDLQAMARIHRDGQQKPCFIYRLIIQGAIEEKIYQRQVTKIGLADAIVDSKKTAQGFTTEELRDLFTLDEGGTCPTHDLLGCECNGLGNTQVLPENTSDDILSPITWGSTMSDPCADEICEEDNKDIKIGVMISATKLNVEVQERRIQKIQRKTHTDKQHMLGLMQYLHINPVEIVSGNEELEVLMEDQILLQVIKEKKLDISFLLSKTTG